MQSILERIKLICEYKLTSISALENKIGASKGVLSRALANNTDIQSKWLIKIIEVFPDISSQWLLTGIGYISLDLEQNNILSDKESPNYPNQKNRIPVLEPEIFSRENSFSFSNSDVSLFYFIPELSLRGCDFIVRIIDNSMSPHFLNGDKVACKLIHDFLQLEWGKPYLIYSREKGILLKRIRKSNNESSYLLFSDSVEFDSFEINKNEITGIALVIGIIRFE